MFHVVPNLHAALKAIDAGVDGIVAEGGEGGGFKSQRDVASMVLLPLVCSQRRRPGDRRGRHLRRPQHGGRVRARRRGRADGHAHGVGGGVAGARQLQAAHRRLGGDRHRDAQPVPQARLPGAGHALQRGARAERPSRSRWRRSTACCRSTSMATSTPRSRSADRSPDASTTVRPVKEIIERDHRASSTTPLHALAARVRRT